MLLMDMLYFDRSNIFLGGCGERGGDKKRSKMGGTKREQKMRAVQKVQIKKGGKCGRHQKFANFLKNWKSEHYKKKSGGEVDIFKKKRNKKLHVNRKITNMSGNSSN